MARKVREIKGPRIISEKVRQEFKEIKKETEEQEESLEEEILPDEPEEFEDFSATTAPVLETIPDTTQNLEQEVANAPATKKEDESEFKYETGVYNMPDYGSNTEQRETGERGMEIRDMSEFRQREKDVLDLRNVERETPQSGEQRIEEDIRKYSEVKGIREEEERRPPFDRRERRKERVLK